MTFPLRPFVVRYGPVRLHSRERCIRMSVKLPRRRFLGLAAAAAVSPTLSPIARAQAYPARPVRILVGFTAGSGPDIVARLIGQWLSERHA